MTELLNTFSDWLRLVVHTFPLSLTQFLSHLRCQTKNETCYRRETHSFGDWWVCVCVC